MRRLASLLITSAALLAQSPTEKPTEDPDPARKFFAHKGLVQIRIQLEPADRQQLRDEPRRYVPATLHIDRDKKGWKNVGIKLKGAAGSFQKIDERPGFTVNLGKFDEQHRLHGLRRFHLNNGAQDESRLCEWLGGEIFTAAGYPAPRVSHALVWLDEKPLGLYVLREGYDDQFLVRALGTTEGNLYDGGFCKDIDRSLEKDEGSGPDDLSDLHQLLEACRNFDSEDTGPLEGILDIENFIRFMALESMLEHWDGYSYNRNNFRLWCGLGPEQTLFLPHGMDQLFGDDEASILAHPSAIAASAVQRHPAWRERYREQLQALLPLFKSAPLVRKIKARAAPLQKGLRTVDRDLAAEHKRSVNKLVSRVQGRYRSLQKQVKAPEPEPLAFKGDEEIRLTRWRPAGETDHITLKKRRYRGAPSLYIEITSPGGEARRGAFRSSALLSKGVYRFTAMARCQDVKRPADGGGGIRLRVLDARSESLEGDCKWTELSCEFEVTDFRKSVELRLDFKATDGKAWFRLDSPALQRIDDR